MKDLKNSLNPCKTSISASGGGDNPLPVWTLEVFKNICHSERSEESHVMRKLWRFFRLCPQNNGISLAPCGRGKKIDLSSAKVRFSGEGYQKNAAFTLAEVLITLAIVGIIAAMTLPTLSKNISKHILAKKLEQTYAILVQARRMANADHGSMYGGSTYNHINEDKGMEILESDLFPFLKISLKKRCSLKELGYKTPIYYGEGKKILQTVDDVYTRVVLANGTVFISFWSDIRSYGSKDYYLGIFILTDLNGPTGPNTIGRDIFTYFIPTGVDLGVDQDFFREKDYWFDDDTGEITRSQKYTHQELINNCKKSWAGEHCGALIKQNHWEFPDDYPLW